MEIIKAGEKSSSSSSKEACFECKICLQLADLDPIVTRCGHLFCWPCLHRWLSICSSHSNKPHCPVCRSIIMEKKLIPIYGIGKSSLYPDARRVGIPKRPSLHSSSSIRVPSFRRTRNAIAAALNSNLHRLSRLRGNMPVVLGGVGLVVLGGFQIWLAWEVGKAMGVACDAVIGVMGAIRVVMYPMEAMCISIVRICDAMETLFENLRKVGEFIENGGWEKVKSNCAAELLDIVFYE